MGGDSSCPSISQLCCKKGKLSLITVEQTLENTQVVCFGFAVVLFLFFKKSQIPRQGGEGGEKKKRQRNTYNNHALLEILLKSNG